MFHCQRCKPLYNNKPFKRGYKSDSFPCVKCECNNHASSCYYNRNLDPRPSSRTEGGGGVCTDCQHNTEGRFCHMCKDNFYRETGKDIKAADVCTLCNCVGPGVQNYITNCTKVSEISRLLLKQIRFFLCLLTHVRWLLISKNNTIVTNLSIVWSV